MRPDDQPRPDLDAAADAVAAALTAVDDDAVATSLRRTRVALAERRDERAGLAAWRWGVVAGAGAVAIALTAILVWRNPGPPAGEIAATPRPQPPMVQGTPSPAAPITAIPPDRIAAATPRPRVAPRGPARVRATSVPAAESARRPDPLAALVAAVQAIPEDAWARIDAPADVTIAPIAIAPLETPPIMDAPSEPAAPGEP